MGGFGGQGLRPRRITSLDELRTAIEEEWEAFPQDHINRAIDSFKPRLKRVIEENGGHILKTITSDMYYIFNIKHASKLNQCHFYFITQKYFLDIQFI